MRSTLVCVALLIVAVNAINNNNRDEEGVGVSEREREGEEVEEGNRKAMEIIRSAIDQMQNEEQSQLTKRRCDFNLPGFDCDNRMMLNQGNDVSWWAGRMTPGKRRSCINADGSSCDTAQIAQELSNRRLWMNGPGRRKRRHA